MDEIVTANLAGTVQALDFLAESLERTWHDDRLGDERIVRSVEGVERLRSVVRRLRALDVADLRLGWRRPRRTDPAAGAGLDDTRMPVR